MTKIAIIDDHSLVRFGLRYVMSSAKDFDLVAEGENCEDAVRIAREIRPDVILLDIRMPGEDGIAALERIIAENPDAKVVMLTTSEADEDIYRSIRAGAKGYMLKELDPKTMVDGIRGIAEGGRYFPERILETYNVRNSEKGLTPRELEILPLLAKGLSNSDIAGILKISSNSVKSHLKHIFEKLGVGDRAEAVSTAISRGLIR